MASKVQVWDVPTRTFHWLLVILMIFSVVTVKLGGDWMAWHERSGVAVLILIVFRIVWGFAGGEHARFASFVRGPGAVLRYAREMSGAGRRYLGHNPLGGWSVLALIASVGTQAVTGLFADDEIAFQGPLAAKVSEETIALMTRIHHYNEKVMYALVALHLGAILFYLVKKKENLVRPMITGVKDWEERLPGDPDRARGSLAVAAIVLVAVTAIVGYVTRRGG